MDVPARLAARFRCVLPKIGPPEALCRSGNRFENRLSAMADVDRTTREIGDR